MNDNRRIIVVSFQFSVVVKSIEKRLVDEGHFVTVIDPDINTVKGYVNDASLFIIYLQTDLVDELKMDKLKKLTDLPESESMQMILIGEPSVKDKFVESIPVLKGSMWVDRPVDMDALVKTVDNVLDGKADIEPEKKRILIIDDDPSYAKMVREYIKGAYKVDIVTNGAQAITFLAKAAATGQVDLILLDYEMPVVDGPQVLQMLRQEPFTSTIPVVFLTGVGTKEAVSRVMALKPAGYILKSTSKEDLLAFLVNKLSN
ncbi:MAG: response regulator [Lachnospiraceae bacterium]|nr:response regulator [Lachnospiraceae bacterium]